MKKNNLTPLKCYSPSKEEKCYFIDFRIKECGSQMEETKLVSRTHMWSNHHGLCQKRTLALWSPSSRERDINTEQDILRNGKHYPVKEAQALQDFEWEHGELGDQEDQRDKSNSVRFNNEKLKAMKNMWKTSLVFIYLPGAKRRLHSESHHRFIQPWFFLNIKISQII